MFGWQASKQKQLQKQRRQSLVNRRRRRPSAKTVAVKLAGGANLEGVTVVRRDGALQGEAFSIADFGTGGAAWQNDGMLLKRDGGSPKQPVTQPLRVP